MLAIEVPKVSFGASLASIVFERGQSKILIGFLNRAKTKHIQGETVKTFCRML